MTPLLDETVVMKRPIQPGDCGVVLRKEGGFDIFSVGFTVDTQMTEAQLENAELLTAIAICLKYPELRNTLLKLATDPEVVGDAPFAITKPN